MLVHHRPPSYHILTFTSALLILLCSLNLNTAVVNAAKEPRPLRGDILYRSFHSALPTPLFSLIESDCRAVHAWESSSISALPDGKRVTRWFPIGTYPRTALEEAILHLAKLADAGPSLVGYEWWIQKISEDGPLSFHVDKDEAVASNEHYLLHPLWSSVFYVTDEGGGTLITNQFSPKGNGYSPAKPTEAAWSFPKQNKFLRFNGTLLHGVIPPPPPATGTGTGTVKGKYKKDRITFLVNFWHVRPKLPNCVELPHEKVTGLKLLGKEEIMQLRKEIESHPSPPTLKQPLINIDLRSPSTKDADDMTKEYGLKEYKEEKFHMDLPGKQHQIIALPKMESSPKRGETFLIHYTTPKKAMRRGVEQEREERKRVKEEKRKWKEEKKKSVESQATASSTTNDSAATSPPSIPQEPTLAGTFSERFNQAKEMKDAIKQKLKDDL